jgi:hypothetical protein
MELWSRRDPVTLFGAIGMSESGWEQLSRTFAWVASRFSNVSDFRFDVEVVEVGGKMAYTLGFERFNASLGVPSSRSPSVSPTFIDARTVNGGLFIATATTQLAIPVPPRSSHL